MIGLGCHLQISVVIPINTEDWTQQYYLPWLSLVELSALAIHCKDGSLLYFLTFGIKSFSESNYLILLLLLLGAVSLLTNCQGQTDVLYFLDTYPTFQP